MNRLRELREDKDITQKELASILNMSQTGYSKYEVGTCDIPTDVLIRLANYYDVSIDYILYVTDDRTPYPRSMMLEEYGFDMVKTRKREKVR